MKGIFIPEITVEMFRDGCLESIEALMAEGQIYDIEYDPKSEEQYVPDRNVGDTIYRRAALEICADELLHAEDYSPIRTWNRIQQLPSAQPEQRPLTEDNYAYCAECDPEVKCLSCGHHIAERPFEVYCNIMCKWVNEKEYCTMFEPGHEKMRKTETQI